MRTTSPKPDAVWLYPLTHLLAVLAVLVFSFWGTTANYFLADDIGEVNYASRIVAGDWHLLWANFTGNYMQVPGMAMYRPWFLVTIVSDFLLWKTNPAGYFLANLAYFYGCSVFLYFLVRQLCRSWGRKRAALAAFFSALAFTANPLHAESISWMVGRVDIVCLMYFLISLLLLTRYIERQRTGWLICSLLAFAISLATKEMAIGLPFLAVCIARLWYTGPQLRQAATPETGDPVETTGWYLNLVKRAPVSWRLTFAVGLAFFTATCAYFAVRYLALGTFIGGYQGSIGAGQFSQILNKWSDVDTLRRLLFPLNRSVFGPDPLSGAALAMIYAASAILIAVQRFRYGLPWNWIFLLGVWALVSLIPVYQLWGLTDDLEGSRFVFFLTAPLSVFLPVLLFAPSRMPPCRLSKSPGPGLSAASLLMLVLVGTNAFIARNNNLPWLDAGAQVRAIQQQAVQIGSGLHDGEAMAILGIPKTLGGAHLILNGATFNMLVSPPFSETPIQDRFLTFDPMLFGDSRKINLHHFERTLRDSKVTGYLRWDIPSQKFVSFDPGRSDIQESAINVSLERAAGGNRKIGPTARISPAGTIRETQASQYGDTARGLKLEITGLDIFPSQAGFLEVVLDGVLARRRPGGKVAMLWHAGDNHSAVIDTRFEIREGDSSSAIRIPLSRYWQWHAHGKIEGLTAVFHRAPAARVAAIRLIPAKLLSPELNITGHALTNRGNYNASRQSDLAVDGDCRKVTGAGGIALDVYKPDFFIDDIEPEALDSFTSKRVVVTTRQGRFLLDTASLPASHYVQIAAQCLDGLNHPVGEYSAPATLYITE